MKPLLEITTVPISIEFKTNAGHFEPEKTTTDLKISRDKGGFEIKSDPVKVNIDCYEARKSASNESPIESIKSYAAKGREMAYQATARYAEEGYILLNAKVPSEAIDQITEMRLGSNEVKTPNIKWIPSEKPKISWKPAELNIRYEMDKLKVDFQQEKTPMKFVPGRIEFTIKQFPDVVIKYVGEPLYVPPSAAPGYDAK